MFEQSTPSYPCHSANIPWNHPICARLNRRKAGVLVVGHGTRKAEGQRQLLQLTDQISEHLPDSSVEGCFLELAAPDIHGGLSQLRARGCEGVVVVPILLFTAAHARSDIPDAVASAAADLHVQVLAQTTSLEVHPAVLGLSKTRFDEIVRLPAGTNCPAGGCGAGEPPSARCDSNGDPLTLCPLAQWRCVHQKNEPSVGLAMVGRGTSDVSALDKMRLFTQLRQQQSPVNWSETGFFAGGKPDVDELLDLASQSGCDTIIVQPHLLFEGELMDQLRQKVRARRAQSNRQSWWITRSLGADPALAQVFLQLLDEATASW